MGSKKFAAFLYMKILILALSGIGDALMFTPALRLLRKARQNAQIHALVMFRGTKEIYQNNPDLDKVIYYDFLKEGILNSLNFIMSLRNRYDVSINVYPSNRKEYNTINFLIGAPKRVGVNYQRSNTVNFGWLNNLTIKENDFLHNVQENIKLIEKLLNREIKEEPTLQLFFTEEENKYSSDYLKNISAKDNELVVGFHPGCATLKNHIKRRWEPEKFAELGKRLISDYSARIFLFGGPEENELKEYIHSKINNNRAYVISAPDLMKSAAILKRCNVFVTNDSSLMHISSALGLRVVAIIGPTNINYIRPWKTEHKIVSLYLECAPCFYYSPKPLNCIRKDVKFKCIKELNVEQVYSTVKEFL